MKKFLRALAWGVGGVLVIVAIACTVLYVTTQRGIDRKYAVAGHALTIPTDSLALARGAHVAKALSKCIDCHGADLGGRQFIDEPPVARLWAANLTTG
ncbi:MAG: hypothetical protein H3C62_17265, partial [Gemmatimonadaceae bacterium]|nr:hypothetical protein [Gemmatimonadaceae bacterium]